MTKMKKMAAGILAAFSMATCVAGMSASAFEASRSFPIGTKYETYYYATAVGSKGDTSASAGTVLAGGQCGVTISYGGKSDSKTGYGSAHTDRISGSGMANSSHTASKGGYYGSTTMTF